MESSPQESPIILEPFATLSNGQKMPLIGLGSLGINTKEPILTALVECNYRSIDTAEHYFNEQICGEALKEALGQGVIKREDLFVSTKMWMSQIENVEKAVQDSLDKLQLDYIDCYYIHWPSHYFSHKIPLHVIWADLEKQVEKGKIRSIGLSNFNTQIILDLLCYAKIKPVTNQIELHPYLTQDEFIKFLKDFGILPVAYSPLARSKSESAPKDERDGKTPYLMKEPLILEFAEKYKRTPTQIVLNWHVQRGCAAIPKASSKDHQLENIDVFNFKLSQDDIARINGLNQNIRIFTTSKSFNNYDMFV